MKNIVDTSWIGLVVLGAALAGCTGTKEATPEAEAPTTPPAATAPESDMPPADQAGAASAEPTAAPAPAAPEAPPITVGAFKMTITGKKATTVEVGADGVAKIPAKDPKDAKSLKFVGNTLQDDAGQWLARVQADGTIEARMVEREMKDGKVVSEKERTEVIGKFVDGDAIESPKGKFTLGDDGVIMVTKPGATKAEPATKEFKLSGVKPETKRAALVLFIGVTASVTMSSAPAATTRTDSAAPAPADAKGTKPADAKPAADAKAPAKK